MPKKTKRPSLPLSVFTPDELMNEQKGRWLDSFGTTLEVVDTEYPDVPIYEYRLVAVHTRVSPARTRKEIK